MDASCKKDKSNSKHFSKLIYTAVFNDVLNARCLKISEMLLICIFYTTIKATIPVLADRLETLPKGAFYPNLWGTTSDRKRSATIKIYIII